MDNPMADARNPAIGASVERVAVANPVTDDPPVALTGTATWFRGTESMTLSTLLLILAFIAFVLAAIGWGYKKTNLLAIGLALYVLSSLITQVHLG
jgi:hypothetical protein